MELTINNIITSYISALSKRSVESIDSLLHPEFKVIMRKAPNEGFLSKSDYLTLISTGKAGGDEYTIEDLSLHVMGATAMAQYTLRGRQTVMHVFLQFIKENENWTIVSNMPYVTACAHALE